MPIRTSAALPGASTRLEPARTFFAAFAGRMGQTKPLVKKTTPKLRALPFFSIQYRLNIPSQKAASAAAALTDHQAKEALRRRGSLEE